MSLIKAATTVGGFTMISRITGFVRDVLIAALLGTGLVADVYVVAFRFPNLFRRLFGEGAFNAAFVPLFAKRLEGDGMAPAARFAAEIFSGLLFVLLIFTAAAEIFMPGLMYLFAPGFADDAVKFDLAVSMTRIAFPYLAFMSLVALLGGILNSMNRFTAAAAAPIVLNGVLIILLGVLIYAGWGNEARTGRAIVWGVSFAGLVQFALLWIAVRRAGLRLKLPRPRYTNGARKLVHLGIPGVIASGVIQLNLVISTIIASLQDGAPAWLYYADRVYQLPLGVVGVAIGVVLLPDLSRKLRSADHQGVDDSQNRALEFALFLTLPAAIALMAMPYPVVQVLFERGAFAASDTAASATALAAYAAGLPAFVMIKIFSPGFFAREDTRTPMYFAAAGVVANIVLALFLFPYFGHVGIALAVTVSAWMNAALFGIVLTRRGHFHADDRLWKALVKTLFAALAMGAGLLVLNYYLAGVFTGASRFALRAFYLSVMVVAGAAVYFLAAWLTGLFRAGDFIRAFRRG